MSCSKCRKQTNQLSYIQNNQGLGVFCSAPCAQTTWNSVGEKFKNHMRIAYNEYMELKEKYEQLKRECNHDADMIHQLQGRDADTDHELTMMKNTLAIALRDMEEQRKVIESLKRELYGKS